jgi:hypothetical protein
MKERRAGLWLPSGAAVLRREAAGCILAAIGPPKWGFPFTLFWFWADWKKINSIFTVVSVAQRLGILLALWLCATAVLAVWEWLRTVLLSVKTSEGPVFTSRYVRVVYASALGLVALVMTVLLNQPAPDIVYKAF